MDKSVILAIHEIFDSFMIHANLAIEKNLPVISFNESCDQLSCPVANVFVSESEDVAIFIQIIESDAWQIKVLPVPVCLAYSISIVVLGIEKIRRNINLSVSGILRRADQLYLDVKVGDAENVLRNFTDAISVLDVVSGCSADNLRHGVPSYSPIYSIGAIKIK